MVIRTDIVVVTDFDLMTDIDLVTDIDLMTDSVRLTEIDLVTNIATIRCNAKGFQQKSLSFNWYVLSTILSVDGLQASQLQYLITKKRQQIYHETHHDKCNMHHSQRIKAARQYICSCQNICLQHVTTAAGRTAPMNCTP